MNDFMSDMIFASCVGPNGEWLGYEQQEQVDDLFYEEEYEDEESQ